MGDTPAAIENVFREESGRIIASLIRYAGSFDLAEEALQDALAAALVAWPSSGMPTNPGAWLTAAARRKLIDELRKARTRRDKAAEVAYSAETTTAMPDISFDSREGSMPDDRLRLIFTCCHPALNQEAQIALTLRTLGGLTTTEIARSFLMPEPAIAQRLVRAKKKIRDARIPYEIPGRERLPERLQPVRAVIYLIFNEGYAATFADRLIREDLCAEAIRLGRLLADLLPDETENRDLLALMLLQDSRRAARVNAQGELVTLEHQDRSLWNGSQISEAAALLSQEGPVGRYGIEAHIALTHAVAAAPEATDWKRIAELYAALASIMPSAVVELNRAVAVAMAEGVEEGLFIIDGLNGLDDYHLFHAARADLLRRLGRGPEAAMAYRRALALVTNPVEREYLAARLRKIGMSELDSLDHVAIPVQDIASAVDWYTKTFRCEVKYRDDTWALLAFANTRLALVIPEQHPAHLGFVSPDAEKFGVLKTHRDGTRSCYVNDPAGNSVEILAES